MNEEIEIKTGTEIVNELYPLNITTKKSISLQNKKWVSLDSVKDILNQINTIRRITKEARLGQ